MLLNGRIDRAGDSPFHLARVRKQGQDEGVLLMRGADGGHRHWRYSCRLTTPVDGRAHVVGNAVDVTAQVRESRELQEQSVRDALTGSYNRRQLDLFELANREVGWGVVNLDLENGELGKIPTGWFHPKPSADAGYPTNRVKAKYLRVQVDTDEDEGGPTKVNIRVPMQLLRAGVRLSSIIPPQARDEVNAAMRKQGIPFDINQLKPENLEELVEQLSELTVDVDQERTKVRIFCE